MNRKSIDIQELLIMFNQRDKSAFASVYSLYFTELCLFAESLFSKTSYCGCDIVHDIFLNIWERKNLHFDSVVGVKAYIYISIKNRYKDVLSKLCSQDKYIDATYMDEDYYTSFVVESEILSLLDSANDILPTDCAEIFRLYMEGWEMKEIVSKVNIGKSAVYKKKQKAIDIIRKKLLTLFISISY